MGKPTLMEVRDALKLILKHKEDVTLNYCVNYARYALVMLIKGAPEKELRHQILYVDNNYEDWSCPDAFKAKRILKAFAGIE